MLHTLRIVNKKQTILCLIFFQFVGWTRGELIFANVKLCTLNQGNDFLKN